MLRISENSWHMRWYRLWERQPQTVAPKTLNLCVYMRVILIYMPFLVIGKFLAYLIIALTSPIWGPVLLAHRHWGWARARTTAIAAWVKRNHAKMAMVLGFCGIGIVIGVQFAKDWVSALLFIGGIILSLALLAGLCALFFWFEDRKLARFGEGPPQEKGDRFLKVAWQYVAAKKKRICPTIEVK